MITQSELEREFEIYNEIQYENAKDYFMKFFQNVYEQGWEEGISDYKESKKSTEQQEWERTR